MSVTAEVILAHVVTTGLGDTATSQLTFRPDFQDSANSAWAPATPQLNMLMTVKASVADQFTPGGRYTLNITG
jgi:hypothetical protein